MDLELTDDVASCITCAESITTDSRFCKHCGALQQTREPSVQQKWVLMRPALLLFCADLVVCSAICFIDDLKEFNVILIADIIMASSAVFFFAFNWQSNKAILKWPAFSIQKLAAYSGLAMLGAMLVHYLVTWFNVTLFDKDSNYYYFFLINGKNKWWMIAVIAVFPAIFEELAYRGVILQRLIKAIDPSQAVYITSLLFALIHLNFLSLLWLIPFAIALAKIRLKERTIWYGVFVHFCFNLTACLFDIL